MDYASLSVAIAAGYFAGKIATEIALYMIARSLEERDDDY